MLHSFLGKQSNFYRIVYDFFIFSLDNVLVYGYYISRFEK